MILSMPDREFKLETTFTDVNNTRRIALAVAVVLLAAVIVTMTTGLPAYLLPINDQTMRAMIPVMPDGSEPLALRALEQRIEGRKVLHVSGTIANRSDHDIRDLVAVIQPQDNSGKPLETLEAPMDPVELLALESGKFEVMAELSDRPGTLGIRFKLLNGPFVPHRDERSIPR